MKMNLLVGTYSEPILFGTGELFRGKGKGIYLCSFDGETIETLRLLELGNPSYLTIDEERRKIYAVNEMKEFQGQYGGGLTEIGYAPDGNMQIIASCGTEGTDPCHVALSPDKRLVGVANFADGAVTLLPLDEHGGISARKQVFRHKGNSVHPIRQKGPHAHSVIFSDNGRMFVPDLGTDHLVCYDCSGNDVRADDARTVAVAPGNGPRFGEFSPDHRNFYLINELGSSITRFLWDGDNMQMEETVSTLPEGFVGDNICSDLHITPDGRYLYASNRGHDSLTGYRIERDGKLTLLERVPCCGKTPRNFAIDPSGRYLLAGNQDSDTIVVFAIQEDGHLDLIKENAFPTPVCIRFFETTTF